MSPKLTRILSFLLCFLLVFQQTGLAQVAGELNIAGYLAQLHSSLATDIFRPLHLRYLSYNPLENNFHLFLDKGNTKNPTTQELETSTKTLLNYFFIGLTLPNDSFWVNLRPDSPDNIIDDYLAQTDVGKIMLETDLQLKKDTAKFTSPETPEGKVYWNKLYKKAEELFGAENITIPTLTRPWIVPDEIIIRETAASSPSAYIYKATLKVMLEEDYLQASSSKLQASGLTQYSFKDPRLKALNEYSSQLIRQRIIPKLNKEINSSKRYAPLRQVYYSLILAQWFKARFKQPSSLRTPVGGEAISARINSRDLTNLTSKDNWSKQTYFKAYQVSFKDGEYNLKEPIYTPYGQSVRSYLSGGMNLAVKIAPFGATGQGSSPVSLLPAVSSSPASVRSNGMIGVTANADQLDEIKIAVAFPAQPGTSMQPKVTSSLATEAKIVSSPVSLSRRDFIKAAGALSVTAITATKGVFELGERPQAVPTTMPLAHGLVGFLRNTVEEVMTHLEGARTDGLLPIARYIRGRLENAGFKAGKEFALMAKGPTVTVQRFGVRRSWRPLFEDRSKYIALLPEEEVKKVETKPSTSVADGKTNLKALLDAGDEFIKNSPELYNPALEDKYANESTTPMANIIATIPGRVHPDIHLIIGAHMDGSGANDNASGVAVVLALMRQLYDAGLPVTIHGVFFDAEEFPQTVTPGSSGFVQELERRLTREGGSLGGVIILDMVGGQTQRQLGMQIPLRVVTAEAGLAFGKRAQAVISSFIPSIAIADNGEIFDTSSDAFVARYPEKTMAFMEASPKQFDIHQIYHTPQDLPETLDYQYMEKMVWATVEVIRQFAASSPVEIEGVSSPAAKPVAASQEQDNVAASPAQKPEDRAGLPMEGALGQLRFETPGDAAERVHGELETNSFFDMFLKTDLKEGQFNRDEFLPGDTPTIAAKAEFRLYQILMYREDSARRPEDRQAGEEAKAQFKSLLESLNLGSPKPAHEKDATDYHYGGSQNPTETFIFYFPKPTHGYKNPEASDIRAYLTFAPREAKNIYRYFVELTKLLKDENIDFSAKAQSPRAARNRYDNIVIYIAEYDMDRAAPIIRKYCSQQNQGIFLDHKGESSYVITATPDSVQRGLSWARDIRDFHDRWGEIMGSTKKGRGFSWSSLVVTFMLPTVLNEMAERQDELQKRTPYSQEHAQTAELYRQESERVEVILARKDQKTAGSPAEEKGASSPATKTQQLSRQSIKAIFNLETMLGDPNWAVRLTAVQAIGLIELELAKQGKLERSSLETMLRDPDWAVFQLAAQVIAPIYAELFKQGKLKKSFLETMLRDSNWAVRQAAVQAIGLIELELAKQGKLERSSLETILRDPESGVGQLAAQVIAHIYVELFNQGKLERSSVETMLGDSNWAVRLTAVQAIGLIELELAKQGKPEKSSLETMLRDPELRVCQAAVQAIGLIELELAKQGKPEKSSLETMLRDPELRVREAAERAIGLIELAKQGKPEKSSLEDILSDPDPDIRRAAEQAIGLMELVKQGKILDEDYRRYELWKEYGLPYEKSLVERYLSSDNPEAVIRQYIKEKIGLSAINFSDGGDSSNSASEFAERLLRRMDSLGTLEPPGTLPKPRALSLRDIPVYSSLKDILPAGYQLVSAQGRTLIYRNAQGKCLALKFLKKDEKVSLLDYESQMFDYLNRHKEELQLKGAYPVAYLINGKRVVRLKELNSASKKALRGQVDKDGSRFMLDESGGYYTLVIYETQDSNYFTYLSDAALTPAAFREALLTNIHDLFSLARYGIIHTALIELFHNLIQRGRPDRGMYLWMVDILRPMGTRSGAGRLHAWTNAVQYPNLRLSGGADLPDLYPLKELARDDNPVSIHMHTLRSEHPDYNPQVFYLASYLGDYLLSAVLVTGRYLRDRKELNWKNPAELANLIRECYLTAFTTFTGRPKEEIQPLFDMVDWDRFAKQMAFFMAEGDGYADYLLKQNIPQELYGQNVRIGYSDSYPSSRGWVNTAQRRGWYSDDTNPDLGPVNGPNPLQELIKANYIFTSLMIKERTEGASSPTQAASPLEKKGAPATKLGGSALNSGGSSPTQVPHELAGLIGDAANRAVLPAATPTAASPLSRKYLLPGVGNSTGQVDIPIQASSPIKPRARRYQTKQENQEQDEIFEFARELVIYAHGPNRLGKGWDNLLEIIVSGKLKASEIGVLKHGRADIDAGFFGPPYIIFSKEEIGGNRFTRENFQWYLVRNQDDRDWLCKKISEASAKGEIDNVLAEKEKKKIITYAEFIAFYREEYLRVRNTFSPPRIAYPGVFLFRANGRWYLFDTIKGDFSVSETVKGPNNMYHELSGHMRIEDIREALQILEDFLQAQHKPNPDLVELIKKARKQSGVPAEEKGTSSPTVSDKGEDPSLRSGSTPLEVNKGGVDFRALPIVTQAISNLRVGVAGSSIERFSSVNLGAEWRQIQKMVDAGIRPSAERLKEYIQVSCVKGDLSGEANKVILCISDILRQEEESCCATDSVLRDILVVLESGRSTQELKAVFIGS